MIVIPAIQVNAGKCLLAPKLRSVYPTDPKDCALQLIEAGAERIHFINGDAARGVDDPRSRKAIRAAIDVMRDADVAVDAGGGVRSRTAAEFWLESGATTAVLGTIAVYRPDIAGEVCRAFPGRIILGLDVMGGVAHSPGWTRDAGDATIHLRRWSTWPAAGVLRTSLQDDTRFVGAELESLRDCIVAYPGPLLAFGGAQSLANLAQAAAAGAAAVVLSLADGQLSLDIGEALKIFHGRELTAPPA